MTTVIARTTLPRVFWKTDPVPHLMHSSKTWLIDAILYHAYEEHAVAVDEKGAKQPIIFLARRSGREDVLCGAGPIIVGQLTSRKRTFPYGPSVRRKLAPYGIEPIPRRMLNMNEGLRLFPRARSARGGGGHPTISSCFLTRSAALHPKSETGRLTQS